MRKVLSVLLALVLGLGLVTFAFAKDAPKKRYIVLALELANEVTFNDSNSEPIYTASSALPYVKEAASSFLSALKDSEDEVCVALLVYQDTTASLDFTDQFDRLAETVEELTEWGRDRNVALALEDSYELLAEVKDEDAEKSIVLVTTGMADSGLTGRDGPFYADSPGGTWQNTLTDVYLYEYANGAIDMAKDIRNAGVTIYTVGVFQTMEDIPEAGRDIASMFRKTVEYMASSDDCYYPVEAPEDLKKAFGDLTRDVGGVEYVSGDVDLNGEINARDARLALRASANLETLNAAQFRAVDVDGDGELAARDARKILRVSASLDTF